MTTWKYLWQRLRHMRESMLIVLLLGLLIWFACSVRGGLSAENVGNLLHWSRHWAIIGMLCVPMTLIIATGGVDLSVASMVALGGVVVGLLWKEAGWTIWLAVVGAVLVTTIAGAINGWLSGRGKLAPLVVTLATMAAYRGFAMGITESEPITDVPASLLVLGQDSLLGLPSQLWLWFAVTLVGGVVFRATWVGAHVVAIGENPRAARHAALPVDGVIFWLYTASGFVAGVAALVYIAQYNGANPNMESGLELKVIACVVLGGTRITGGKASVLGSVLGVLVIGLLEYNLDIVEFPKKFQPVVTGLLVIVAAVMNEKLAFRQANPETTCGKPG